MDHSTVRITTGARLHFGPLSYRPASGRHFGGLGMMVDRPGFGVELRKSVHDDVAVVGHDETEHSSGGVQPRCPLTAGDERLIETQVAETLHACRSAWSAANSPARCQVTVCRAIPAHTGFGSGTQLRLAIARAWRLSQGLCSGSPTELAQVCGRGRRSAIGLWGFEWGGVLVDAGQRDTGTLGEVAAREEFPESWRVLLMSSSSSAAVSGEREESWMSQLSPMTSEQSGELSRIVLTEILPALRNRHLEHFRDGVREYGNLVGDYFAQVQGGRFADPNAAELVMHLEGLGVTGVVQSSWGPTLCAFFADDAAAEVARESLQGRFRDMTFTITPGRNYGADVDLKG